MRFDFTTEQALILYSVLSNLKDSLQYQEKADCWVNDERLIAVFDRGMYQTFQDVLEIFNIE